MKRRNFLGLLTAGGSVAAISPVLANSLILPAASQSFSSVNEKILTADLVIAGCGLGGCAAALAALRNNLTVILTEQTDWRAINPTRRSS